MREVWEDMALKLTVQLKCDCCGKVLKFDAKVLKKRSRREPATRVLGVYTITRDEEESLTLSCDPLTWELELAEAQIACSKKCALSLVDRDFDVAMQKQRKDHIEVDKT